MILHNNFCKNTEKLYKRYQKKISINLLKDTNYSKNNEMNDFIIFFKEKIISSIMNIPKLNILTSDITIDNHIIKNYMTIFTTKNNSKDSIPKYIITDAGNYSESNEDTRLRSIAIILKDNFDLIAVIIGCGETSIKCHSKHEYYGLLNTLIGLKSVNNNISKSTIWLNDIVDVNGNTFLKDNSIDIKYKTSNSSLYNFTYKVFIKGICDALLHHKQIFTHIMKSNHNILRINSKGNIFYTPTYKRNSTSEIIKKQKMTFNSIENIDCDLEKKKPFIITSIQDDVLNPYPVNLIKEITENHPVLYDLNLLKNQSTINIKFDNPIFFNNIRLANIKSHNHYLFKTVFVKNTLLIKDSKISCLSEELLIAETLHLINIEQLTTLSGWISVKKIIIEKCADFDIQKFIQNNPHINDIHYIK